MKKVNETIEKFGYPQNVLAEYEHWVVLLRPKQITAGCMVLASREGDALPNVATEAYSELPKVTGDLESALRSALQFDKINYILLMMVDKEVHFHVIPRYSSPRDVAGVHFEDSGWPKHPAMTEVTALSEESFQGLLALLKEHWPA